MKCSTLSNTHWIRIWLFKVNNRNTRTRCGICSKLTKRVSDECYTAVGNIVLVSVSFALNRFHNWNLTINKKFSNLDFLIFGFLVNFYCSSCFIFSQLSVTSKNISSPWYCIFHFSIFKARFSWSGFENLSLVAALNIWLHKSFFFGLCTEKSRLV